MKKIISIGKCCYCNKMYKKAGISRHLNTHLNREAAKETSKTLAYHVRVDAAEMFLNLLISGKTTFQAFDDFLRQIWLECCGHLSMFGEYNNEIAKSRKVEQVFYKGFSCRYEYDFGSTTPLGIKVLEAFHIPKHRGIKLLSRNEPLEIMCQSCKKEVATELCSVHWGESAMFFCENCWEDHEETCEDAEYAGLPVVNSPRMGTCAYTGGAIDLERDGVFVKA